LGGHSRHGLGAASLNPYWNTQWGRGRPLHSSRKQQRNCKTRRSFGSLIVRMGHLPRPPVPGTSSTSLSLPRPPVNNRAALLALLPLHRYAGRLLARW
jgi:hypothetical protein